MNLFVLGLNHKTAPIELREKFSIAPERESEFIRMWEERAEIPEKTVISTCNRTELYGVAADTEAARRAALGALSRFTGVAEPDFESNVYFKTGQDSVAHLFSVASGLDSLAVGETEILGQVKNAYLRAQGLRLTGGVLNPLFQKSLSVGKKVRSQTDIGAGKVSVASIAIDLATKIFNDLSQKRLLLVGSGDVARQVCEAIVSRGSRHFWIANRSPEKAADLARAFGAEAIPYADIDEKLAETDILISSAASADPIFDAARVSRWMHAKKGRSLFLIDLGVPRNIEAGAGDVADVYLYNLDDLKSIAIKNVAAREHAAASCREIILAATEAFMRRLGSRALIIASAVLISFSSVCAAAEVNGRAIFEGPAPARAPLDAASDPFCSDKGLLSEQAIVSAGGGLKNVFVYVKSGAAGTFDVPSEPVVLDQDGCRYEPRVFGLRVGQPLELRNSDDTLHNVHTTASRNKSFNVGMPVQNMRVTKTFEKPEVMVPFECDVHPWMAAYAGVLDHPFFAVSGEDGSFTIRDLPPGDYLIQAWHEKLGAREAKLTLAPGDSEINIDFAFSS